jgi:hypothetical protein
MWQGYAGAGGSAAGWEMDRWSRIWVDGGGNVSEVSGGESVRNDGSWSTFHETSLYCCIDERAQIIAEAIR